MTPEVSLTVNLFYHEGSLQTRIFWRYIMENRITLLEQLRILYVAALYLV